MKQLVRITATSICLIAISSFSALAALSSFDADNSFSGSVTISDTTDYSYDFLFDSNDYEVDHFRLTISFSDVHTNTNFNSNVGEQWRVSPGKVTINSNAFLLIPDSNNAATSRTFDFYEHELGSLFSQFIIQGKFVLAFTETTNREDSFTLTSAQLSIFGSPTSVPAPGAALLFGSGLFGLLGLRQRQIF